MKFFKFSFNYDLTDLTHNRQLYYACAYLAKL